MDIISVQKNVRVSPKKMRGVADVARKLTPQNAISKLPFLRKKGSEIIIKVIKSALASARQKGISDDVLIIKEIQIGEGPRLKRGRAASRGRLHPYKRRMSHVRVVLQTIDKLQSTAHSTKEKIEKKENVVSATPSEVEKKPLNKNILSKIKKAVVRRQKTVSK
jgi:large subunit ribosomal protein L22